MKRQRDINPEGLAMPIKSHSEQYKNLTIFTITGSVTLPEIREALQKVKDKPAATNMLWDFSGANVGYSFNVAELENDAIDPKTTQDVGQTLKTALVAASDIGLGLVRLYASYLEVQKTDHEVQVFDSLEKAHQWLENAK